MSSLATSEVRRGDQESPDHGFAQGFGKTRGMPLLGFVKPKLRLKVAHGLWRGGRSIRRKQMEKLDLVERPASEQDSCSVELHDCGPCFISFALLITLLRAGEITCWVLSRVVYTALISKAVDGLCPPQLCLCPWRRLLYNMLQNTVICLICSRSL